MIRRYLAAAALTLTITVAAQAQIRPQATGGDARLQSIDYRPEQIVTLEVATGYQLSLEFAPDERIESVAVGDGGAWLVSPTKRGNHLFIKLVQEGVSTNMTVVTDTRTYLFDLQPLPGPAPDMAYAVRFNYPKQPQGMIGMAPPLMPAQASIERRYRISGRRELRPEAISDDGIKTYIKWSADVALPAVYALDHQRRETLVNGMMRDGVYVVDGVSSQLVFRIDNRTARAVRIPLRRPR